MAIKKNEPLYVACLERKINDNEDYIIVKCGEYGTRDYFYFERLVLAYRRLYAGGLDYQYYGVFEDDNGEREFYFAWSQRGFKDLKNELKRLKVEKRHRLVDVKLGRYL